MVDQPESAAIRKPRRLSPPLLVATGGCLLGIAIAAGGHLVAERQEASLAAQTSGFLEERRVLSEALEEAMLTAPRLRLEELASLPLVSEFVALSDAQPDSPDAADLKAYLQTVLDAAIEETGLARIALETNEGALLLASQNPATDAGNSSPNAPGITADVPGYSDPDTTIGRLNASVPESRIAVLAPADGTNSAITAGISDTGMSGTPAAAGIPSATRMLAIAAGLAAALFGILASALLRKAARPEA